MEKEFIPYEQALALKELGFNESCFVKIWWLNDFNVHTKEQFEPHITMNGDDIKFKYQFPENHPLNKGDILKLEIPTFSQAFRWFREKHWLDNAILKDRFVIETEEDLPNWYYGFKTYEEAELECLKKLIEIVKNK